MFVDGDATSMANPSAGRAGIEIYCKARWWMKLRFFGRASNVECRIKSPGRVHTYALHANTFNFIPLIPNESHYVVIGCPQWPLPSILMYRKEFVSHVAPGEVQRYIYTPPWIGEDEAELTRSS